MQARERCKRELRDLGFDVQERRFEYSAYPGLFATPLFGACAALLIGSATLFGLIGMRLTPAVVLVTGAAVLIVAGRWMAGAAILTLSAFRTTGVNIEATRMGDTPSVWLAAHLDTKSQPVSSLVRIAGTIVMGLGALGVLFLALALAAGARVHPFYWSFADAVTLLGWVPVGLSMVGNKSPGALDNASGVAAVVEAARRLEGRRGVGVLITDAEELGLAGARAWARDASGPQTVLNCDGVDDGGDVAVMTSRRCPASLRDAIGAAARECGTSVQLTRTLPGMLTDASAFAGAGHASVTFSKGTLMSLARVHRPSDDLAHLRGDGLQPMATLLAATARLLT